jgi:hypothetical protein
VIDINEKRDLTFISQDKNTKEIISCIGEALKHQEIEIEDHIFVPKKNSSTIDRDGIRSCNLGEFKSLKIESNDCQVIIDELLFETGQLGSHLNSRGEK